MRNIKQKMRGMISREERHKRKNRKKNKNLEEVAFPHIIYSVSFLLKNTIFPDTPQQAFFFLSLFSPMHNLFAISGNGELQGPVHPGISSVFGRAGQASCEGIFPNDTVIVNSTSMDYIQKQTADFYCLAKQELELLSPRPFSFSLSIAK